MLKIESLSKTYFTDSSTKNALFQNFNLNVHKGEFVTVIGSNGSGKTSLMNLISGTLSLDQGRIFLKGMDISRKKEYIRSYNIGRVYQDPKKGTCPSMTILENMSMADHKKHFFGLSPGIKKNRIQYFQSKLESLHLGLENKLNTQVGMLSGGQRQALALLIATMVPLDLLLLDEHTAALDPKTCDTIMELTNQLVRENKITTLMITHNLKYAVKYGSRIIMMHEGNIILDKKEEEKQNMNVEEVLSKFNEISIELGNSL